MKTYWCKWKSGNVEMLAEWQADNETDLVNRITQLNGTLVEIVDAMEGTPEEQADALLKKGHSLQDAIMIHCDNSMGIAQEHIILKVILDQRQLSYEMISQQLIHQGGKHLDKITVALSDGTQEDFYFDITLFFGKG